MPPAQFRALVRVIRMPAAVSIMTIAALAALPAQTRESRDRHVYASVVDKAGVPVANLGAADFTVTEDGKAREILRVSPASAPMQIALLIDNSQAAEPLIFDLRRAATTFIHRVLEANPDNEIALVTFGERPVTEVDYTTSSIALLRAAGGLLSRSQSGAYMLQAIPDACKALKKRGATRPTIVAFTSEQGPEFSDNRHARVIESLKAAQATLWTISFQGSGVLRFAETPEGRERTEVLNDVAVSTGGENKVVLASSAIEPAFVSVATMLTSEYDVVYSRPVTLIPPERLQVALKRPGLRLWAPKWTGQ